MRYFAYGSNLLHEEMIRWCPHARAISMAKLNGYRLDFTRYSSPRGGGVADVVPDESDEVWGVLYDVPEDQLNQLDQKEGVPHAYNRHTVEVETADGKKVHAMTYVVVEKSGFRAPSSAYLDIMLRGARSRHLPDPYIERMQSFSDNRREKSDRVRHS